MKIPTIVLASLVAASSAFAASEKSKRFEAPNPEVIAARMLSSFDSNKDSELNSAELELAIDSMIVERIGRVKETLEMRAESKGETVDSTMTFMLPVGSDVALAMLADHDLDGNGQLSMDELKESAGTIRKFNLNGPRGGARRS